MPRKLVLVRHARPEITRTAPAADWKLSEAGRRDAASLAAGLRGYRADAVWCSKEPKANETAEILGHELGLPIHVKDGLEEHHRPNVPFFPTKREFERVVQKFFSRTDQLVLGTETARQARDRFTAAVASVLETDSTDTIVVTHGTVMTLYVARVADVQPMRFWRALKLPSFVEVGLSSMRVGPIVGVAEQGR